MRVFRTAAALFIALFLATTPAGAQLQTFEKSSLTIATASGSHRFAVELAVSGAQMTQGLMFRKSMAADAGMLFDYGSPRQISMWMKNTYIPLDMLFVGMDGKIVAIHERAVPESLDTISPGVPARAVIEVNGGTASRLGIKPGDLVHYSAFGTS